MKQLFCDCKTDEEKSNFFLSGRAFETGIIAYSISNDVAMAYHRCAEMKKEIDALRAKVAAMEKQEQEPARLVTPTAYRWRRRGSVMWQYGELTEETVRLAKEHNHEVQSLYALPGAQPAPSIPEGWKPIPEKHPTFDLVDLRLADGSVLCGCVPQSDGDYWWKGPSGEVFIDSRYAPATHWRLRAAPEAQPAAAPEAKP